MQFGFVMIPPPTNDDIDPFDFTSVSAQALGEDDLQRAFDRAFGEQAEVTECDHAGQEEGRSEDDGFDEIVVF